MQRYKFYAKLTDRNFAPGRVWFKIRIENQQIIAMWKLPSVVVQPLLNSVCPCQTSCRNLLPLGQYGITVSNWWWLIDCSHTGLPGSLQHLLDTAKLWSLCRALTVSSHLLPWPRKNISLHCFHIWLNDGSWKHHLSSLPRVEGIFQCFWQIRPLLLLL